jgi:hypothetical protein
VTTPAAARPDRYGTARRGLGSRGWIALAACAVAAAVGWAAWVAWSGAQDRVDWTDIGFTIVDAGTTKVTFEVDRQPGQEVVCTVRALNGSFAEVGRLDVVVPPSDMRTARAEATIATSEQAVTGTVKGCRSTA